MKLENIYHPSWSWEKLASFISQPSSASRWASSRTWNTDDGVILILKHQGLQVGLGIYDDDDDDDDDDGDDDNLCFSSQRQCCTAFLGLHTGSFISEIVEDVWSLTVKGIDKLERKQLLSVSCELVWQNGLGCKNGKRLSWIHPTKRKDLNRNFRNGPTSLLDKDSTSWNNIQ